jgi:hypothetical protein
VGREPVSIRPPSVQHARGVEEAGDRGVGVKGIEEGEAGRSGAREKGVGVGEAEEKGVGDRGIEEAGKVERRGTRDGGIGEGEHDMKKSSSANPRDVAQCFITIFPCPGLDYTWS